MMEYPSQESSVSGSLNTSMLQSTPNAGTRASVIMSKFGSHQESSDTSLFSSSLPVLLHEKFIMDLGIDVRSIDGISSKLDELHKDLEVKDSIEEIDLQGIGNLLPDEDELFDGIMSGYNQGGLPSLEQVEDCDLFSSGGGIELDTDSIENVTFGMARANISDCYVGNGNFQYSVPNGVGTIAGEHPYGEHPSRTLFVRNINSNVEDAELKSLFEQYGDIRSMYTHCKHRGFVMISYYDIRHARNAMRALQNKPLRRRKLDIHFSIPKDNPSDKDLNQGTLVVFNLNPSVSNDVLRQIFGAFGEVKEIRETPQKKHHKFVEFYDARAAEDALRSLNRSDIAGKRIKLEPSRPGGARRNFMHQLSQELDSDEMKNYKHHQVGSPSTSSPPAAWVHFSSPVDNGPLRAISISPALGVGSPVAIGLFSESTSVLTKIAPIGKEQFKNNQAESFLSSNPMHDTHFLQSHSFQSHSFPEQGGGMMPNLCSSSGTTTSFGPPTSSTSRMGTLTGPQFLWGSSNSRSEYNQSPTLSVSSSGNSFTSDRQRHGFTPSYLSNHGSLLAATCHHVGSAPSGIPFEKLPGFLYDLPGSSFVSPALGSMGILQNEGNMMVNSGILRGPINPGSSFSGILSENALPGFRMMSSPRMGRMFVGNPPSSADHESNGMDGFTDRAWIREADNSGSLLDNKKQFQLDLSKIISREDTRTTLMIKNIPNKYTSKMLLSAIDENHRGTYDFLYLPIDFKNKCNVGYAFLNMVSPSHIVSFYQAFNGRRWEKFNSEKVASLAYARIQGKAALVSHFQNSSLMNEDKRCRPILFDSEVVEASDQEPFLPNGISTHAQHKGAFLGHLPESLIISKVQVQKPDSGSMPGSEFAE